jgi:type II secretory pathway pseudopilin PulG
MLVRNQRGSSLVEVLIAAAIMSVIATAFLSILLVTYKANAKITNVTDTASALRQVKERLGMDIRAGRTLGDVYGTGFYDPPGPQPASIWVPQGVDTFPGASNPVYGAGQAPPAGWPASWGPTPYQLSNTCLIVQVPIGNNHNDSGTTHAWSTNAALLGWPTAIYPNTAAYTAAQRAQGPGNPPVGVPFDNVETHVYKVVADPDNAGEYLLQWCSFPGYPVPGYLPAAHSMAKPQTILKGIVGPMDNGGNLKVFQFIDKTKPAGVAQDAISDTNGNPNPAYVANYTGIVVNLEIRTHTESVIGRKGISIQPVGFKTEIFLRNNAIATTNGS